MQNRLTPNTQVVSEHWEGHLGGRGPPEEGEVSAPHGVPQPRHPDINSPS